MATDRLMSVAACAAFALWLGAANANPAPILLELSVDPAILDEVALREAIRRELARPLVASPQADHAGELSIRSVPGQRVSVTFKGSPDQAPLVRVVSLPRGVHERTQWIAWLVGNLARDEAADWLAQHRGDDVSVLSTSAEGTSTNGESDAASAPRASEPQPTAPPRSTAQLPAQVASRGASPSPIAESVTLEHRTFNLSLWYKWLQLHPQSASMRFALHLGAGYGRVGAIRGAGFDLLHHRVDHEVQGVIGSFVWTRAPRTQGLAWSAGVVTAEGQLRGVDFAWLLAYRDAARGEPTPRGVWHDLIGLQFGGVGALSRGGFMGVQAATFFTTQQGALRGLAISTFANVGERVDGAQLAAVNCAGDVSGLQFGLVNYARRVDGIAIGLVNISSNVRVQALPWAERDYHANLGVRYVYAPLTFGYSVGHDPAKDRTRVLFGIGARFARGRLALAPAANVGFFVEDPHTGSAAENGHENDVRVSFEWEVVPRLLGLTAGPSLAMQSDRDVRWRFIPRWFVGLSLF